MTHNSDSHSIATSQVHVLFIHAATRYSSLFHCLIEISWIANLRPIIRHNFCAMAVPSHVLSWTRDQYEISTDPSLIPLDALNNLFSSDDFHWGKPLPVEVLQVMLEKSTCFVLYETCDDLDHSAQTPPNPQCRRRRRLIGFGRWITDMVTVAYLTDVYIVRERRNQGLGAWMMQCVDETFRSMPHLRGMILIVDRGSEPETLYRKHLAMDDLESPAFLMDRKGRGAAC